MNPRAEDRWRRALPLALPTLGGLAYLYAFGAPPGLIAVNLGALLLGMGWTVWGRLPSRPALRLALAGVAAAALFLPLLTGPDLGGVARWLPFGPVMLHSGALLVPLIVVLAAGVRRWGEALLALAAAGLALQPDAAALAALALGAAVLAVIGRRLALAAIGTAAAGLAALTWDAGGLEPQRYTEGVLADVARQSPVGAAGLGLLLLGSVLWFTLTNDKAIRPQSAALAAVMTGFGMMACLGPFPFPLIGYGAAPILGFALALGADARPERMQPLSHRAPIG